MTALKAYDVQKRFTSADKLPPVILVFGPDRGLVTEVTGTIASLFEAEADDPFAVVKLDAATVTADPARLVDEARTVSLFGGKRLILVRDGASRNLSPAVAPLLKEPPQDAVVVLEAGDLRRGTGLRKEVEGDRVAAAVHCPADTERDLERMIEAEAASFGLAIGLDARTALMERLGADRAASRSEVTKACLHALGSDEVTVDDIDAVVGDVSVGAMADAVEAAFLGQPDTLDRRLATLMRQGVAPSTLLMTAQRMVQSLEMAAISVREGSLPTRAVETVRPPLYGARKTAAIHILDRWSVRGLRHASRAIAKATFSTRLMPALAPSLASDVLHKIAHRSSGAGR
ncbi:MAG: DNA polymerase III subunit delta [Pseudomonadota bacterium]